jgi:serine/threonine protein kinase
MPFTKQPNAEPIPGYRLIAPLGRGGFGEVWKCEAPGGLFKAIKFVYGNPGSVGDDATQAQEELRAIQRVKGIRHPFLLSMDRVESNDGELMIVTELADQSLHDVLVEYQRKGQPGVPREELLRYLGEAAEVLDLLNQHHGLQHLDVKPRNFLLLSKHIKVADFGLVTSLVSSGTDLKLAAVTPLYASPEVFKGKISGSSDQYSLACSYMELLTGKLPFSGSNSRQLLMQHLKGEPSLGPLTESDRPIVARALAKDPLKRFPSCLDFLQALLGRGATTEPIDLEAKAPAPRASLEGVAEQRASLPKEARSEALKQTPNGQRLTDNDTPRLCPAPPATPAALAGYQFVESQGSSPLADAWKAIAPDGRPCQVQYIYGFSGHAAEAVRRLQALLHPALVRRHVVQSDPGRLTLVNDLGKETVRDRWHKCQHQGLPGIPRLELLGYLRTVAEVLDYLYQQQSLHHLGLNPRQLLLVDGALQVADFGLAHLFWLPARQPVALRNARYAPPELFERQVHRTADQFSLAVMYPELLTGICPFAGQQRTMSAASRTQLKPDLSALPESDREAIGRALLFDPSARWPSCSDLMRALEEAEGSCRLQSLSPTDAFTDIIAEPDTTALSELGSAAPEALQQILRDMVAQAGGEPATNDADQGLTLSEAGDRVQHKFRAGLPVGAARLKVEAFRQQCGGQPVHDDEESSEFYVPTPANFWRQMIGQQPGLDVHVQLARPHVLAATPIDVTLTIQAVCCGPKKAAQLVKDLGTSLLDGLRASLLVNSEKRTQDRLLWPYPIEVCAIEKDGTVGPPIVCRGKDISLGGIGFYLPHELPTSQVLVHLPAGVHSQPLTIPATLVRALRCADGWYDVGALFRLEALRESLHDICVT